MSKKFSLSNKVAMVTGGGSGIGKAIAITFAKQGANVNILDSNFDAANSTVNEILKINCSANAFQCDVSNLEEVLKTVKSINQIDILVNNAGTTKFNAHENLSGLTSEDFLRLYSVNTVGPYMMLKEAQSYLLESSNPSVVNVGSIAGVTGIGSSIAYASSKGALLNMTKSLARALGPIRVNAICPGFIQGDWLRNGLGDEVYEMVKEATEKSTPLTVLFILSLVSNKNGLTV